LAVTLRRSLCPGESSQRRHRTSSTPPQSWSNALQAGIHPKVVSERLGHATISITLDTYSHAIPAMQEEAAALIAGLVFAAAKHARDCVAQAPETMRRSVHVGGALGPPTPCRY